MVTNSKLTKNTVAQLFHQHPILRLDTWTKSLGRAELARERARYYVERGRLRLLTNGLYAVVPPGAEPKSVQPDPYLVAAALRADAILSHHAALELLGVARSVFYRYTYFTASVRRPLHVDNREWIALRHPTALVRRKQIDFGTRKLDRQGVVVKATGPERTLVDGFAAPVWSGGLEEHVESCAALRDLDPASLDAYLRLMGKKVLFAAVGWFVESHPATIERASDLLQRWERQVPRQPVYLDRSRRSGRLQRRWNLIVPDELLRNLEFEGTPA